MKRYRVITNGDKFRVQSRRWILPWRLECDRWQPLSAPPMCPDFYSPWEFDTRAAAELWIAEKQKKVGPWRAVA